MKFKKRRFHSIIFIAILIIGLTLNILIRINKEKQQVIKEDLSQEAKQQVIKEDLSQDTAKQQVIREDLSQETATQQVIREDLSQDTATQQQIFTKELKIIEKSKLTKNKKASLDEKLIKVLANTKFKKKVTFPKLVIVIDDFGYNVSRVKLFLKLKQEINFAVIPNLPNSNKISNILKKNNKIILLHLPMEPKYLKNGLEQTTLMINDSEQEINKKINISLENLVSLNGINNHMGSGFTDDEQGMHILMKYLQNTDLFFLDSKTSNGDTALQLSKVYGVPYFSRDIFLDNKKDYFYIARQLIRSVKIAYSKGSSIAIGHPHPYTYRILKVLLPEIEKLGVEVISLKKLSGI